MIRIQTLNDIEWLKAKNDIPGQLIKSIEQDFLDLFETEGDELDILKFRLRLQQAFILLNIFY